MADGTYIGQDGRTYILAAYYESDPTSDSVTYPVPARDLAAAKAALDALIEEEAGKWVYVINETSEPCRGLRVSLDGKRAQIKRAGLWTEEGYAYDIHRRCVAAGYAKGREAALEGVRELVKAVLAYDVAAYGKGVRWGELIDLAKAVKP